MNVYISIRFYSKLIRLDLFEMQEWKNSFEMNWNNAQKIVYSIHLGKWAFFVTEIRIIHFINVSAK